MPSNEIKSLSPIGEEIDGDKEGHDEANLARLGKRPVLKVSRTALIAQGRSSLTHSSGTSG